VNQLTELLIAVQNGEIDIADLTEEQQGMVLEGYRELADRLLEDPAFAEFSKGVIQVIEMVEAHDDDAFEDAICAAEQRGSTYWEIESDYVH
jgi:pullulanase/glycogen debranching enzyme